MIIAADVTAWSREPAGDNLDRVVAAVNDYVGGLPIVKDNGGEWNTGVKLGAVMLAARLAKRRNSPNGLESTADLSVTYIARYDSDIARLLGLDGHRKPGVA